MTLRSAQTIDRAGTGTTITSYTPASSDTFSLADLPATLRVANASGSPINVTVVDGGRTSLGTAAAALSASSVPATTGVKSFVLTATMADPSTQLVTVNFSATTSVSCELTRTG